MQDSQTDSGVQEQIRGLVSAVVSSLQEIARLEPVLRRGMVHPGGPHYRLHGTTGPISIGEDECAVFGRLIAAFRPAHCFLIGNAFGMSSVFIAKMMELHGGESVVTLDDHSEGDGLRCFEMADRLRERMDCGLLVNKCGSSPGDIRWAAGRDAVDLIFIDGEHRHPQVTRDFQGVQELVREHTIVCWHDYWMPGIPESVAEAERIKIKYGCAASSMIDPDETIEVPSVGGRQPRILPRDVLVQIIEPRVEEIFAAVHHILSETGYIDMLAAGAVLTGGSTQLDGMPELAEQILGLQVRCASPMGVGGLIDVVKSPTYATAVGLVKYGSERIRKAEVAEPHRSKGREPRWGSRFGEWLREVF